MSFHRVAVVALSLQLLLVNAIRKSRRNDWVKKTGVNCYPGNGADIPPNTADPAAYGQSLAECQALCSNTPQCTAVAMRGSDGECYLRTNVVESRCVSPDPYGYDTYFKTSGSSPTPSPAPTPAPSPGPPPSGLYPLDEEVFVRSHRSENLKDDAGSVQLTINASGWEKWVLRDAGSGKVYIQSHRGEYLQDNNGQVGLSGNAQDWEQWTISGAGEGKVFFMSHRGQYLQDNDGQVKMSGSPGSLESWTLKSAVIPEILPDLPRYDTAWKALITGSTCPPSTSLTPSAPASGAGGQITCELGSGGVRKFRFPVGIFDIDEQVVVPSNTHIEGNANPVDPADKSREPDPADQTYFLATAGVSDANAPYCGTYNNLQPGEAQRLRIGFLLHSNTVVKHINFQGRDTIRPYDNGSLCGGAVFETPGCVSPGWADGVGNDWANPERRNRCYDRTGRPNDLITGDGRGVENILIESVRLNGLFLDNYRDNFVAAPSSQIAVWVAQTKDGSATKNVTIDNLVAMTLRGDGINFHGNVQDSLAENCHIENTGDDIYAAWGGYAENLSGVVFRNNVGKNPGVTRNYGYGVCVAIYGATDVTVTGTKCYDLADWNPGQVPRGNGACQNGPNCNSCLAAIKDGWFGAVYPPGHQVNIYDNEYVTMAGAPITDRPEVRDERWR